MLFRKIVTALGIKSLRGRLKLSFICLLIILFILGAIPILLIGKNNHFKQASSEIEKTINLQQVVVNNWLDGKIADIATLAQLLNFKEKSVNNSHDVLKTFGDNHREFSDVIYANEKGIVKLAISGDVGEDIKSSFYFIESKRGNTFISDVMVGKKQNDPFITISTPVYDNLQNFNGVILGKFL